MTYKDRQKEIQKSYFKNHKLGGKYGSRHYDHILVNEKENFINQEVHENAEKYFNDNGISWHRSKMPTGNTLSSQIACINHLFPIRNDKDAVLALIKSIDPEFEDVEILKNDKQEWRGFISFEVVSKKGHLNEKSNTRGSNCTSLDAVILAKKKGKSVLVSIEWKYTEVYNNVNQAKNPKGKNCGTVRLNSYCGSNNVDNPNLIQNSSQLKPCQNYEESVYFFEPFYQLMRQTLWAEQMVNFKDEEVIKADDYIHIHVVPKGNKELLYKKYSCSEGKDMLTTWKSQLKDPRKYVLIDPAEFFSKLSCEKWKDLICYLKARYWQ